MPSGFFHCLQDAPEALVACTSISGVVTLSPVDSAPAFVRLYGLCVCASRIAALHSTEYTVTDVHQRRAKLAVEIEKAASFLAAF
jgi:hypothetical protein